MFVSNRRKIQILLLFFYRRPLIGRRANICFINMYWLTFQEECLPLFCSNNHMMINGRCIPVITNIITKAVGLVVENDVEENSMFIRSRDFNTSTKNAIKLQSRCLDFKWTYVGLSALDDFDLKVTIPCASYLWQRTPGQRTLLLHKCYQESVSVLRRHGKFISMDNGFPPFSPSRLYNHTAVKTLQKKPWATRPHDPLSGRMSRTSFQSVTFVNR